VHWVEAQGQHLLNHTGLLIRVFGVVTDVTHRKRAEDAMIRAQARLTIDEWIGVLNLPVF